MSNNDDTPSTQLQRELRDEIANQFFRQQCKIDALLDDRLDDLKSRLTLVIFGATVAIISAISTFAVMLERTG